MNYKRFSRKTLLIVAISSAGCPRLIGLLCVQKMGGPGCRPYAFNTPHDAFFFPKALTAISGERKLARGYISPLNSSQKSSLLTSLAKLLQYEIPSPESKNSHRKLHKSFPFFARSCVCFRSSVLDSDFRFKALIIRLEILHIHVKSLNFFRVLHLFIHVLHILFL